MGLGARNLFTSNKKAKLRALNRRIGIISKLDKFLKSKVAAMLYRNLILAMTIILTISGCGIVQTSQWVSFTDNLDTGSEVNPAEALRNWRGDIEVSLTKAADPQWLPDKTLKYPYAGILMQFKRSGESVDISASEGLAIEYRLAGRVSLILKQKNIDAGREYRIDLAPQKEFSLAFFPWNRFEQPLWVDSPKRLDLSQMVGISFMNSSKEQSTAQLSVRTITFPGL